MAVETGIAPSELAADADLLYTIVEVLKDRAEAQRKAQRRRR